MTATKNKTTEILLEQLKTFEMFDRLTIASFITFSYDIGTERVYQKGDLIRKQNQKDDDLECQGFSVILEGFISVVDDIGEELCTLGRGDFYGEQNFNNLTKGIESLGDLRTQSDQCRVLVVPRNHFHRVPNFEFNKLKINTSRLSKREQTKMFIQKKAKYAYKIHAKKEKRKSMI